MKNKKIVIVESPTKAKTIKKFLPPEYVVESCMGHLRDLPESTKNIPDQYKKYKWSKIGVNVDDGFKPIYCVPESKQKVVNDLVKQSASAKEIILATDEDREGESISWHLKEILTSKKYKGSFKRMVFHEITKEAIQKSLKEFRDVDKNLVYSQEARRILDRLVGYSLSPVLWKYITRGLSAGRVQSVAVRILSEREIKRMQFKKSEYRSIIGTLKKGSTSFDTKLLSYKGKNLVTSLDFDRDTGILKNKKNLLISEREAKNLIKELKKLSYKVSEVKVQKVSKKPPPPFITSTLQQEANRNLNLSSKDTMRVAQQLYERGFITYMRTDSTFLSNQAVKAARSAIEKNYGKKYLPPSSRLYKTKSKSAQEAHEAIRPAGSSFVLPKDAGLSGALLKLYEIIWKRTLASQMLDCEQKRVSVKIKGSDQAVFSTSGTSIVFDGYYRLYPSEDKEENLLPHLKEGDSIQCQAVESKVHETKPLPRFTEASLIQTLEKEGIGRPSTYAAIIATIQKRGYVFKDKNTLSPTVMALIVTDFLTKYFPDYVNIQFTSDMETALDQIAIGKQNHKKYLNQIYFGSKGLQKQISSNAKVIDKNTSRSITFPHLNDLTFFAGPYGAYVVKNTSKKTKESVSIPPDVYPGDLTQESILSLFQQKSKSNDSLGKDPKTKESIYVLTGRFGSYVQRGEEKGSKKASIPKGLDVKSIDLELALQLLDLPAVIGAHPKSKKEIKKGVGRFGPYIVHDNDYRSIRSLDDFFGMTLKQAVSILDTPKKTRKKAVLKELGEHPDTQKEIQLMDGKFGPYIQSGTQRVSIPSNVDVKNLKLKQALELLNQAKKTSSKLRRKAKS